MNALLAQFIPEARDLLEQAGAGMLALERASGSPGVINDVFRAVHTLKGSSGLFDLVPLTRLVHAAEDLLGEVRTGDLALNSDMVDRLLDCLDVVSRWIDALEQTERLPEDAEAAVAARVTGLRDWLGDGDTGAADPERRTSMPEQDLPPPAWLADLPEEARMAALAAGEGERLCAWQFMPEEDCFFRGDDPLAMVRQSPGLLTVRVMPRAPFGALADIDPLACVLSFEVLSAAGRAAIEEHMRYVIEAVDVREIGTEALAFASGPPAHGPVFADFARLAREHVRHGAAEALARSLSSLSRMVAPDSFQASALRWCQAELDRHGLSRPDAVERWIAAVERGTMPAVATQGGGEAQTARHAPGPGVTRAPPSPSLAAVAREVAVEQIQMLSVEGAPPLQAGRFDSAATVLRALATALGETTVPVDAALAAAQAERTLEPLHRLVASFPAAAMPAGGAAPSASPEAAPAPGPTPAPPAPRPAPVDVGPVPAETVGEAKVLPRVLRVDQGKIDAIMNLVAELIVAKNGLSYLATRAEQVHGSRLIAREIKDQFAVIDRITQGLQVSVMSVRMMPVSHVFQRFPRLVRDISRRLGKKIDLVIEGEDTEADKNVLESLADPLIHMVRNSLDHGIEPPEERRAEGKAEVGVLRIVARQESDFVVIAVDDDGRGIDAGRVKAKAVQRGLVSAEAAEHMGEEEAANLVFLAGFSTKDEVSDLSGRGVGMDVVRSAVLKAGGDVSLRTCLGRGTAVTLRLPLTMAVTRIVTIECHGRVFGIPMELVVETVKIPRERIHRIKDAETFVLREAVVPLLRLGRILGLDEPDGNLGKEEEAVMVVRVGRDRVGMIVDGFRERLEVIVKPLEGLLEGLEGFSGTALLGDGRVLLILDLQEVLQCR